MTEKEYTYCLQTLNNTQNRLSMCERLAGKEILEIACIGNKNLNGNLQKTVKLIFILYQIPMINLNLIYLLIVLW